MRDEDERCVQLFAEFVCPTLIADAQRKKEGATRGEFGLGEAERSFLITSARRKHAAQRIGLRGGRERWDGLAGCWHDSLEDFGEDGSGDHDAVVGGN